MLKTERNKEIDQYITGKVLKTERNAQNREMLKTDKEIEQYITGNEMLKTERNKKIDQYITGN